MGVNFFFNFTDVRAEVDFVTGRTGVIIANNTLANKTSAMLQTGDNVVYNDTATRMIQFYADGKNKSRNPVIMECFRCVGACLPSV